MRKLLKILKEHLEQKEALVLVTITAATGATPRGAGARMLVGKTGRIWGTIGGGAVEYRSQQIASEVLARESSRGQDFSLTTNDVEDLGMICGGDCHVYFHYIPAGDAATMALVEEAEQRFAGDEDFWLVCDMGSEDRLWLTDETDRAMAPYLSRQPQQIQAEGRMLYIEQLNTRGKVYVFGGGHVAQELVPILAHVGFRCTVMDDRAEFADPQLFPGAERVICGDFRKISDYLTIGAEDYVCVMTRGHAWDTLLQAQVLRCRPCYCGVIGSRRKAAGVRKVLREEHGLSEEELDLITTPIGLPIQAETPEEIAISIAGQMILHRAERSRKS